MIDDQDGSSSTARPRSTSRRRPTTRPQGPFVAPADVLLTEAPLPLQAGGRPRPTRSPPSTPREVPFAKPGTYAVLVGHAGRRQARRARPAQVKVVTKAGRPDPGRRRAGAEGRRPTRWRRAKGDVATIDTREPAERHARARLRRRGRQEAGRAAVRDAAAVPVARLRPGDRHRAADEGEVRRPDGVHPPGGLRRQRPQQGPARAAAGSSTCRPSRGCSSSARTGKITARLEGSFGAAARSRTRSRPRCETRARGRWRRRWPPSAAAGAGVGVRARARPAPAPADPAVAVRLGGGRRARRLVRRARRAVAAAAAGAADAGGRCRRVGRLLGARAVRGRCAARSASRCSSSCSWPATSGAGTALDNFAPTFVLITFWVGLVFASIAVRRRLPRLQPVARARARCCRRRNRAATRSGSGRWPAALGLLVFTWIELVSGWGERPGDARHRGRSATRC